MTRTLFCGSFNACANPSRVPCAHWVVWKAVYLSLSHHPTMVVSSNGICCSVERPETFSTTTSASFMPLVGSPRLIGVGMSMIVPSNLLSHCLGVVAFIASCIFSTGGGESRQAGRVETRAEERLQLRQVKALEAIRAALVQAASRLGASAVDVALERPRDPTHADLATNLALTLAKTLGQKPRAIAERLIANLELPSGVVRKIEIAGPGFINFFLAEAQVVGVLPSIITAGATYGKSDVGSGKKINIEFVSANPTGPLHVGHGRGAALGDGIAALLEWTGWSVTREFYVNDAGTQIERMAQSLWARVQQCAGRSADIPEGGYHGEYLTEL